MTKLVRNSEPGHDSTVIGSFENFSAALRMALEEEGMPTDLSLRAETGSNEIYGSWKPSPHTWVQLIFVVEEGENVRPAGPEAFPEDARSWWQRHIACPQG